MAAMAINVFFMASPFSWEQRTADKESVAAKLSRFA
jgi:hypothetical protein